jgi:hypothetical protein
MTPKDLDDALKNLARTFVREVKQQDVPLRVSRERAVDIIRTKKYQHRDEISLILEARDYIKGRLPVRDRATAVAILLQRMLCSLNRPNGGIVNQELSEWDIYHLGWHAVRCVPRRTLLPRTSSIKAEAELSWMYAPDDPPRRRHGRSES